MITKRTSSLLVLFIIMILSCQNDRNFVVDALQLNGFRTLVYAHLSRLYAYDVDSKTTIMVADFYDSIRGLVVSQMSLNPSGSEVVFTVHSSPHPKRLQQDSLLICDLKSGNVQRLEIGGDGFRCPKWSPDGERIAFFFRNEDRIDKLGILERTVDGKLELRCQWDSPVLENSHKEMWWTEDGTHLLINLPHVIWERVGSNARVKERTDSTAKVNIMTGKTDALYDDVVVYEGVDRSKIKVVDGHAIYFLDNEGHEELLLRSAERIHCVNTTQKGDFVIFFRETFFGRSINAIHVPSRRSCRLYTKQDVERIIFFFTASAKDQ